MKILKAILVGLSVLTCLSTAHAGGGVRGDGNGASVLDDQEEDYYMDDEEAIEGEGSSLERFLTKPNGPGKRCPFPGESRDCEGDSLYKMERYCNKYCYVCPCFDDTYYDIFGDEIQPECSRYECESKNPNRPCSKYDDHDCCKCSPDSCEFLEILPRNHYLCGPDPPPDPPSCESQQPDDNGVCAGFCPDTGDACFNSGSGHCACKPECDEQEPYYGKCTGFCPVTGEACVNDGDDGCTCEAEEKICALQVPNSNGECDGDCPVTGSSCVSNGSGGCTCELDCEDQEPDDDGDCDGVCPITGDACFNDARGSCKCEPDCDEQKPDDDGECGGFCPITGEACVNNGNGSCSCEAEQLICGAQPPNDEGNCEGDCPVTGSSCISNGSGECTCELDCEDQEPDDDGDCDGVCPITGESCVNNGDDGCTCEAEEKICALQVNGECDGDCPVTGSSCVSNGFGGCTCEGDCEDQEPDGDGKCAGFCPVTGEACVNDGDDGCTCEPVCEYDETTDTCQGVCPISGESCIQTDDDECSCEPVCENQDPDGDGLCDGVCPTTGYACVNDNGNCICGPDCEQQTSDNDCDGLCPITGDAACVEDGTGGCTCSACEALEPDDDGNCSGDCPISGDLCVNLRGICTCGGLAPPPTCSIEVDKKCIVPPTPAPSGGGSSSSGKGGSKSSSGSSSGSGFASFGFGDSLPLTSQGGGTPRDNCVLNLSDPPSCDSNPRPDTITFLFNGGTNPNNQCASSTITQVTNDKGKTHTDFECSGQVDPSSPVNVEVDDDSGTVAPGETFTVDIKSIKEMSLGNGGGTQEMEFHTSCSQPLVAGTTAGALTIVGLGGQTISNVVTYSYEVTNSGSTTATISSIFDDQIGEILDSPFDLEPDESETVRAMGAVTRPSVTNEVRVTAVAEGSDEECSDTDSVTVTIAGNRFNGGGSSSSKGKGKGGSSSSRRRLSGSGSSGRSQHW